jgi:glycosyltransferase involved in cell wall biosynthesis
MHLIASQRICVVPRLSGVGGMVSFQHKLVKNLLERGIEVCFDLKDTPYAAVLVVGGIKDLPGLRRARSRCARIVQRLDGMNWLHRRRRTGLRHYLRAEYGNMILALIRSRLAHQIVYQSGFSRSWWESSRGPTRVPYKIVFNGVNLADFSPYGPEQPPSDQYRLLLVEASLGGGYEGGLETAVELCRRLAEVHRLPVELLVAGKVPEHIRGAVRPVAPLQIKFLGLVEHANIPALDRSAHLLYSADINAACPNSVIEAMACGLPVVSFATGALPELVEQGAGELAPYGGDPWKLDPPDIPALAESAVKVLFEQERYRAAARRQAEARFDLEGMTSGYLEALLG